MGKKGQTDDGAPKVMVGVVEPLADRIRAETARMDLFGGSITPAYASVIDGECRTGKASDGVWDQSHKRGSIIAEAWAKGDVDQYWFQVGFLGKMRSLEDWLEGLKINDKTVFLVALRLAFECHHFAAARGILHHSIQDHLGFVLSELDGNMASLINFSPVVAGDAANLTLSVRISFCPKAYRLIAEAAKNRVAGTVDGN